MNFCQTHWDELKGHIETYGLMPFVADSGEQAMEHVVRDLKGESTVVDFEPLMGAAMAASNVAMSFRGGYMLLPNPETGKPPCPICALKEYDWCQGAAYQMVLEAQRRGILPATDDKGGQA